MAETFLNPIIELLLRFLAKEIKASKGLCKKVESLKLELEIIQPFLRDAEAKSERGDVSDAVKAWMKQVRQAAEGIEDVIDDYRYQCGFSGLLGQIKSCKSRFSIASKIDDLKDFLHRIKETGQAFGLTGSLDSSSRITGDEQEDEFVDAYLMWEKLKGMLVEGTSSRQIISLVGQGGIGKTTLARMVYKDEEVRKHFDCQAWITVSQLYNTKEIIKKMRRDVFLTVAGSAGEENSTMEELIQHLNEYLETKRYVVILDDIWQMEFWEKIKYALPNNNNGSRIIVTTRNDGIAESCRESSCDHIENLQSWSKEQRWELFCKKAFRSEPENCCPEVLKEMSYEIVRKCHGLPLAIAAIAGLLSCKNKAEYEWKRVVDNLSYEFKENPRLAKVSNILSLSYHDLPHQLKPCFLYFGVFQEDCLIDGRGIQQLWIAEGFVEAKKDKTSMQVAEEYLHELINRNMVSFEFDDRIFLGKSCYVHDMMRDFILSRQNLLNFSQIIDENELVVGESKCRRLSILGNMEKALQVVKHMGVRSLFVLNLSEEVSKSSLVTVFENFKLLKILHLVDVPLHVLPKEVGNLICLKHLNLKGTKIQKLPKSIGKLRDLQYLNISNTLVHNLPKSIGKLRNLKNLFLFNSRVRELPVKINKFPNLQQLGSYFIIEKIGYSINSWTGLKIQGEVGCLHNLETILMIEEDSGGASLIKDLDKLRKLRKLGISKLTREDGRKLGSSLKKMQYLENLYLLAINEDEVLDLAPICPPPTLSFLSLHCRLENIPCWISNLWNLQSLHLFFSRLTDEPLKHLKNLPNLVVLTLFGAYDGEELHCEEGGFRKLKKLSLRDLNGFNVVKMDVGTLPQLESLDLGPCPQLKELPYGIECLSNLKTLLVRDMPREFVLDLQPGRGSDYCKIKHLPSVLFSYQRGSTSKYDQYKLGDPNLLDKLEK
ncbi:hypothetical protein UlMin_002866 [Ulmus minor]